jgi:hypothetical protein
MKMITCNIGPHRLENERRRFRAIELTQQLLEHGLILCQPIVVDRVKQIDSMGSHKTNNGSSVRQDKERPFKGK